MRDDRESSKEWLLRGLMTPNEIGRYLRENKCKTFVVLRDVNNPFNY